MWLGQVHRAQHISFDYYKRRQKENRRAEVEISQMHRRIKGLELYGGMLINKEVIMLGKIERFQIVELMGALQASEWVNFCIFISPVAYK